MSCWWNDLLKNKFSIFWYTVHILPFQTELVFLPCGHVCCCMQCAGSLCICPLCRREVQSTIRLYRSQWARRFLCAEKLCRSYGHGTLASCDWEEGICKQFRGSAMVFKKRKRRNIQLMLIFENSCLSLTYLNLSLKQGIDMLKRHVSIPQMNLCLSRSHKLELVYKYKGNTLQVILNPVTVCLTGLLISTTQHSSICQAWTKYEFL